MEEDGVVQLSLPLGFGRNGECERIGADGGGGMYLSWEMTCGPVPRHISRMASTWRQLGRNSLQTLSGRSFDWFRDLEEPVRPVLLFREETRTRPRVQGGKKDFFPKDNKPTI